MKNKMFIFISLISMGALFSGCTALLVGGAAGYEVSAESAKADVDGSYDKAYDASLETIRAMGGISEDKKAEGWVKSDVDHYHVAVHIEKLPEQTVRITVSAWQDAIPEVQYARDVLARILNREKQQPVWLH